MSRRILILYCQLLIISMSQNAKQNLSWGNGSCVIIPHMMHQERNKNNILIFWSMKDTFKFGYRLILKRWLIFSLVPKCSNHYTHWSSITYYCQLLIELLTCVAMILFVDVLTVTWHLKTTLFTKKKISNASN